MSLFSLVGIHLVTIIPAFFIGTYMMIVRKGDRVHKFLGKLYLILMGVTGTVTLFMNAYVGPQLFNHFGFIHLFSILTLYSVPQAYFAAKRGDIKEHKSAMIGLYIGGLIIAGFFALLPGRTMHNVIFG